ncbi:RND transporter [Desulfonema ishimotonii]|uniref:RND transporter n=1 Tax=Desulfonema ishimotonii TaxID=45657 RepID=A0A401G1D4_9BACT|nr:efflux transporter outer membrane subunit [Desulfonema ishimotonii]GBC63030.1 RND transporter [Desulfonema ishimotonii]
MKRHHIALIISLLFSLQALACSPFAPDLRQSPEGHLPEHYSRYQPGDQTSALWWRTFNDPELDDLVREALAGNFSIREAWARLRQARALAVQAGASLYPDLTLNSGTTQGRQRTKTGSGASAGPVRSYALGMVSSYELDLWGRIRSGQEAARLEAVATREDLSAAAMTLAASVTERWADIISRRMQRRLLEKQLKTNQTYLELVELRFRKSMVSALDVYQQRQVVEQVRAQIPQVAEQEQRLMHELALLLGKPPRAQVRISRKSVPWPDRLPETGLPAALLANRPDVRAAGLRLRSADWQVAAAEADRLPAITLTGTAQLGAEDLDLIFDNWLLRLAGNLAAPILDGNRRRAEVERTLAKADENLWAYRQTVYTALKEVEDALVGEVRQREHIRALERQMDAARSALTQAGERYRKGISDYLPVLTQLLAVQRLERDMIQRRAELLIERVSLHRALGGTWTGRLTPDGRLSKRTVQK